MRKVVFIDTTVLCEVLRIPGKSQQPEEIANDLRVRVDAGQALVLPTAAIVETGNHIAQLGDGHARRDRADSLARILLLTADGEAPWTLNAATWDGALLAAISNGPGDCPPLREMASRGIGAGDVSILAEAEAYRRRVARVEVEVWTLDEQLGAYA